MKPLSTECLKIPQKSLHPTEARLFTSAQTVNITFHMDLEAHTYSILCEHEINQKDFFGGRFCYIGNMCLPIRKKTFDLLRAVFFFA